MCVCSNGHLKILDLLLQNINIFGTINKQDKYGLTAFEYALKKNHIIICKMLLQYIQNKEDTLYIFKYNITELIK
jgi:ankyrin repeat protein